jgi:hypothetical protein
MVRYISQYDALVQTIHTSDSYQNATQTDRQEIDKWLDREEVKKYFGSRVVPQLTLHESFVLGFANSDAQQQRTPEEQQKVMTYISSERFKEHIDNLESRMSKLLGV